MKTIELSSNLEASADMVWAAVKTPAAFRKITRGLITMPVINQRDDEWHQGETVVGWVFLFGVIPFSRHRLHVARIDDVTRTLTSRESGGILKRWNHDIVVSPISNNSCHYLDRIEIDAGIATPCVVVYARWFYRMRQRRWGVLAKELSL